MIDKQELKRLRETYLNKIDVNSDYKSVRQCYLAAKNLYECLKYFDSRFSRSPLLYSSDSQRQYAHSRIYKYPSEYYCFRSCDVCIEIHKDTRKNEFFVSVQGWKPQTFPQENHITLRQDDNLPISGFFKCGSDSSLKEVVVNYYRVIAEYIDYKLNRVVQNVLF